MKKMLALLAVLCSATAAFAQNDAVVRWKTIVGNITVSNNDAVGGINPGTTPWSTVGGRARVNLATGRVSFEAVITVETGSADREANMWTFARKAIELLEMSLKSG